MHIALCLYLFFMLLLGVKSYYSIHTYKDYVIAGANQTSFYITNSLLASMIGASTTLGIISLTAKIGFPAFWWLGVGSICLMLQSIFLTKKVRQLNANTLPHVAHMVLGKRVSRLMASIIVITWIGIIAAQFIVLSQLLQLFTQIDTQTTLIIMIAVPIILYTVLGGQLSVIRTDAYQFIILFCTVIITTFFLYGQSLPKAFNLHDTLIHMGSQIDFFNARFTIRDFMTFFLITGLAFFLGPDIFSRNLAAKNAQIAQKSTFIAAIITGIFAIFMALIGVWSTAYAENSLNPIVDIIQNQIPAPLGIMLCIGLISALVSSADTCILSAATIIENDIIGGSSIKRTKSFVIIIGTCSLMLALFKTDIIKLLLSAYSIYVPGIVIPLFTAIMLHNIIRLNTILIQIGILLGSICGVISAYTQNTDIALYGIGISGLFSILATIYKKVNSTTF